MAVFFRSYCVPVIMLTKCFVGINSFNPGLCVAFSGRVFIDSFSLEQLLILFLRFLILTLVKIRGHLFCRVSIVFLIIAYDQIQVILFFGRNITELIPCFHCILSDDTQFCLVASDVNLDLTLIP